MALLVRGVDESDLKRWLPLWTSYNRFYGRAAETALPEEVTCRTWQRFLDPLEPVVGIVAELDGELVGLAHYLFHLSTISLSPTCYLQDLFTAEHARGRGIARALIERVFQDAKASGASRVYWQTQESNRAARVLYDRLADRSDLIVYRKTI